LRSQPLAAKGTAAQAHHLGVDRGFVDEDQAIRLAAHSRLTPANPDLPRFNDVVACAFRRQQRFFYM
jgi:hypothetical protein